MNAWKGFIQSIRSLVKLRENPGTSWDDIYYAFCITPEPDTFKGRMSEDRKILRSIYSSYFAELIFMGTGRSGTATYAGDFLFDTKHVFCSDAFGIQMDLRYMYAVVNAFFELAGDVICRYSEMKRELNMIDFSDFEHYALLLLRKPDIGEYYRQRYKEIYIDEYQDTSSIQEAVISLVSGGSIFMVGDVKQSIYRFRHARPEIFLDKMLRSCIELNENFRSLGGIIAASNSVFLQLMSKEAGEIDYENGHELIPGREGAEDISEKVTILLTDIGETPDVDDAEEDPVSSGMSRYEKEACTVALEAAKLLILGEKPGDIVVLARTGNICRVFAETFEKAGLPVIIEKSDPSPDIYELKILESLMNIIDNPRQDIHLAAVMRSPVFAGGFDENELLTIRTECKDKDAFFYECVDEYLLEGSDAGLKKKTADFISELERLRKLALCLQPGDLLDLVVRGSGLEAYAAAMPDPGRRSDLMHRFAEWVRAFTQARHCGIHEAVIHLSELKEKGIRDLPFAIEESTEDRIKIMTIHKSKGLQYKTVFLAGTSSRFRTSDSRGSLIYSADGLPGVWMIEPDKQYKYPTPTVFAAAEMIARKDIAEEMRLMYVAMTRAKDRLFISGVTTQKSTCPLPDRIPAPHIVLSAKSMLDWVLMSVAGNPHVDMSYFGIPAASDACRSSADKRIYPDCWDLRITDGSRALQTLAEAYDLTLQNRTAAEDPQDPGKRSPEADTETEEDKAYIEKLRNRFFGNYRFEQAVKTPLKLSVSEIKRKWTAEDEGAAGINLTVRKLDLSDESRLSASEKGTAVHSFIRYVQIPDFDSNVDEEMIISRIGEMDTAGILDPYECEYLKNYSGHLKAYFSSPLADRIRNAYMKSRSNVLREVPFTLAVPFGSRDDASGYAQGDFQLVQGMIDCWFIEGDKAVVADYKTDNLSGDDETILAVLRQRYGTQLRIYSEAVERICSLKVEKAVIWLFSVDKEFIIC